MKRIVILGAGTGGTLTANRLRRFYPEDEVSIDVVDQNNEHLYQPGLLFVPFGLADAEDLVRPRNEQLHHGIKFHEATIDRVDIASDVVRLNGGTTLGYDVLVVATGAHLLPDETEGLTGALWNRDVFTFYSMDGARALARRLASFEAGRIVVNFVDLPIKCPVAPLEFSFLTDWYFHNRGIRRQIDITYVTPLDGAFTKPVASQTLSGLLSSKHINLVTEFNTGSVDNEKHELVSYDGKTVPFDIAVIVPLHGGADFVKRSPGLGDELNFIPTDPRTLQSRSNPNIFAIGDATDIPASKAGSVSHFEGEIITENIRHFLAAEPLTSRFDGHTNCFIETGFDKALLIDFNYDTEPLPGHFPMNLGLPLLKESHLNHLGKLLFQTVYWHSLLPGRDIPGIGSAMPKHGKHTVRSAAG